MSDNPKHEISLIERTMPLLFAIAMTVTVLSIVSFVIVDFVNPPVVRLKKSELQELKSSMELLWHEVEGLQKDISNHQDGLETLVKNADDIEVAILGEQLEGLGEQLNTLRLSLGGDVERSLSVALLRKDLEAAVSEIENALDVANRSTDRIYDQNKWFLGLLATMTLSLTGLSISVFKARREIEKEG